LRVTEYEHVREFAMVIEEMTDRDCRAMLAGTNLARLACAVNNQPYIVPIHVDFNDSSFYGFATLGQKIEWMRQNPLVCLEIDKIITHKEWASIVVFGLYEELPDTPECKDQRGVAEALFQRHPVWWEPAAVPLTGDAQRNRILFRILISHMTGRRARPDTLEPARPLGNAFDATRRRWFAHLR
jgi:uncharacterized protein